MKAVAFHTSLPVTDPQCFVDATVDAPQPGPRDLLVAVRAVSVNPVDTKIRAGGGPGSPAGDLKILGWDAAGVVQAVGAEVTLFAPGDAVYYAGAVDRPGANAEFQIVDERLVGRKPAQASFAEAAALPLTTITAWEMLFDRMRIPQGAKGTLLVLGGAGGVGSIGIQLARALTGLTVIATASRPESETWCLKMGAHHVVDHSQALARQIKALAPAGVDYVLALTKVEDHYDEIVDAMAPQGAICLIETPARPIDIVKLKPKSISLHWEFMFTRSKFQTPDMGEQGRLLNEVADLVDAGKVVSTLQVNGGPLDAANLTRAHALVESGRMIGKVVLELA